MRASQGLQAVVLLALVGCGSSTKTQHTRARGGGGDKVPAGSIVTDQVVEMNSKKFGRPPTEFNAGHPEKIQGPKAEKTATGFQVKFASSTTITTPTVYDRAVIVSGGFGSRELYAFEAQSGAQRWAINLNDDGPSSAACERGVCVVNTESCTIFAIAADTGASLWSYYLGDPLTSAPTDAARLQELGHDGVTALICDSTNAMREGISRSEADVAVVLEQLIREAPRRVAVTTFASNVARIRSVAEAARATGRELVVVGRAMYRVIEAAQITGYLDPDLLFHEETAFETASDSSPIRRASPSRSSASSSRIRCQTASSWKQNAS